MPSFLKFMDVKTSLNDSNFVIFGVPFDKTSSFRRESNLAPNAIREASYNYEPYIYEYNVNINDVGIHDAGNLDDFASPEEMIDFVETYISSLKDKFHIMLGGEHTVTIGAIKAKKDVSLLVLDAHLDYRNEYMGIKNSHACVLRRCSEILGTENVFSIGVRSMSSEELIDSEQSGLKFIMADDFRKNSIKTTIDKIKNKLSEKIYLSIDMDVLDPIYAPAVGTPEPYGLNPLNIKEIINALADRLVGCDVVEITPRYDNGNTCILATKIIQEIIGSKYKSNLSRV
jgi:agmatinase